MSVPHPRLDSPAAIAFSGGGDSTAMLHAFRGHPQVTHAFLIDHALRDGSADDAARAAATARALGYIVETQRWAHDGVSSGIQVKARQFRYAALGAMCRAAGLAHLLTAHTADDQAETLLMRLDRQTGWRGLAGMPARAYAPLWPALADVTLHRPWLGVSRAALRAYNRREGLTFIDDPSNENRDFTRIRARQALRADPDLREDLLTHQTAQRARLVTERAEQGDWLARQARISPHNFVTTDDVPPAELLLHLLRAVSGTGGPIDRARRLALREQMQKPDFKAATLAGAWIVRTDDGFVFTRDMVAVTGRRGQARQGWSDLPVGEAVLWDGRFLITARRAGVSVGPADGQGAELRHSAESKAFFGLPAAVRPTLPAFRLSDACVAFGAGETDFIASRATAARRLHALFQPSGDKD